LQDYRLYFFEPVSRAGDRCARPQALREPQDAQAIRSADGRRQGQYAELWRGPDLVKIFEPD
jgi:hypothetical protein